MIAEAEQGIYLVDQAGNAFDLITDLLRSHEDMGVVLRKAADPHQSVKLSGFLMAVDNSQLAHPQGKIPIGTGLGSIDKNAARAVHGLNGVILIVDHRGVHIVFIMIPMSGRLPKAPV